MHTYKFIIIAQEVMATLKIGCINVAKYVNNDRNVGLQSVAWSKDFLVFCLDILRYG